MNNVYSAKINNLKITYTNKVNMIIVSSTSRLELKDLWRKFLKIKLSSISTAVLVKVRLELQLASRLFCLHLCFRQNVISLCILYCL